MKHLLIITALVFLVSCSKTENITRQLDIPTELSDCQFFNVAERDGNGYVSVVRCPNTNSVTTTRYRYNQETKQREHDVTAVIDGVGVESIAK